MTRTTLSLLALALLAACGSDFAGTYDGNYQGHTAKFVLTEDGDQLGGTIHYAGIESKIEGRIDGDEITGEVTVPGLAAKLPFRAKRDGESIDWVYTLRNPLTGQTQEVRVVLRSRDAEPEETKTGSAERDPRLVGSWRRTSTGRVGRIRKRMLTATDVYCRLGADGSFQLTSSGTGVAVPGRTIIAQGGGTTTGEWKTEAGALFSRVQGGPWTRLGTYQVSGNALVVRNGNDVQYWER